MQFCVFDDMTQCSEQEVARLLAIVSPQRREQALAYKHLLGQYCCLKSYEMLMDLLTSTTYTIHSTPLFHYNEYGQPRLECGPYFSISHCKKGIAVAVSEQPIGIDIETIRDVQPGLIAKTMNDAEQTEIAAAANQNLAFTRFWTQKEAYLKMIGTGIISDLKTTLVDLTKVAFQTIEDVDKGYVISLAHGSIDGDYLP